MRIGAARWEPSRANGERNFWHLATASCPQTDWLRHYSTTFLPNGDHFLYKADDGLWWVGKISARTTTEGEYLVRFLDDP